jgi:hypothetical protein
MKWEDDGLDDLGRLVISTVLLVLAAITLLVLWLMT